MGTPDIRSSDSLGLGHKEEPDEDETEFGLGRPSKRLRRIAVRSASLPTAAVAVKSRRAERLARRKRERALPRVASGVVVGGMQVDG